MATLTTLVAFTSADGANPHTGVIIDSAGNLYGTTVFGGASNDGTVYEVNYLGGGAYSTTPTTLATFSVDASGPTYDNLFQDSAGNLYGTTGGVSGAGYGTVFEMLNTGGGTYAAPITLVDFSGSDGSSPMGGLITDAAGNLFGTTYTGGANLVGTVFEIANLGGGTYASTPTTLATFDGANGQQPMSGLTADAAGNLFGTTYYGGANGLGSVFEIKNTNGVYASTPTTLYSFANDSAHGFYPQSGLTADSAGNLFGTTQFGGANGVPDGTVYELVNNNDGTFTFHTVVSFDGADGAVPLNRVIIDAAGNLFGTTQIGGASNDGTVFEIAKNGGVYDTTPTTLATFDGSNGYDPYGGLTVDSSGNLFGTTVGGVSGSPIEFGTVFEITNSGFQTHLCYLQGTRILTPTGEVAIEELRRGDLVVTRFGGIQPIKWIGRQSYAGRFARNNRDKIPVRIRAGALGDRLPARDLYVSPGHSMLVEGNLLLAKLLVNGLTITQDHVPDEIHYHQIELEGHDCVIAEGTWSESFADGEGLREQFHNVAEFHALFPDYRPPEEMSLCAPRPERGTKLDAALRPVVALASSGTIPGKMRGSIDQIDSPWKIHGWAQDLDHPELPVLLEVLLEDQVIGLVLACDYRNDLEEAGIGSGHHSFVFASPVKIRTEALARVRIRRAVDGVDLTMTDDCRARVAHAQNLPDPRRLRLTA